LIQNNGVQAAVISQIAQFRSQTKANTVNAARSSLGFKSLLTKVTRIVIDKPVFQIQNLGGNKEGFRSWVIISTLILVQLGANS
jgi:hypothetical protein